MKKLISLILISVMLISFVGCNRSSDDINSEAFESVIFRVAWTHGGEFFENALNSEKLNSKYAKSMPIYRVDTKEELEGFKESYNDRLYIGSDDEELIAKYDDKFFKENSLLIVYVESGSGSYRFGFDRISITKDSVCVHVIQTNDPNFGTDDMAGWIITVAVPDSLLKNCTSFDAVFDGYKDPAATSEPKHEPNEPLPSEYNFTGRILEKLEGESYLVEVTDVGDGNFAVGNEVVVNSSMLSNFQIGDMLNIQFDGKVTMSIPPQVVNVLGVTFIQNIKSEDITVTRVGSGYAASFLNNALNASLLDNKQGRHHPIFCVGSKTELDKFISDYDSQLYLKNKFTDAVSRYNDEFFKESSLLLVHVQSTSGSYTFGVGSINITKDSLCVHVIRTNNPLCVTDDMAGWIIAVPVKKSDIASCKTFDSVHDGYVEAQSPEA